MEIPRRSLKVRINCDVNYDQCICVMEYKQMVGVKVVSLVFNLQSPP